MINHAMQTKRFLQVAAWAFFTFVVFATLSPYALRPELTETEPAFVVTLEHVGAFGLLGLLFVLSYPERLRTVCLVVLGSALSLELAQGWLPDRHGRLVDALEKAVGGGAGIVLGIALLPILTIPEGLLSKINRAWISGHSAFDGEVRELIVGLIALVMFALGIVLFRRLNW